MACSTENHERLVEFARGGLEGAQADALLDHVQTCAACGEEFDLLAGLTSLLERESPSRRASSRNACRAGLPRVLTARRASAAAAVFLAGALGWWASFGIGSRSLRGLARIDPVPFIEGTLRGGETEREPRFRRAMEDYSRGDYASAAVALAALLAEDPEDHKLRVYLGVSYLRLDRPAEAAAALEPGRARAPGILGERVLWYLGMAHLLREDGEAARMAFSELAERRGAYRKDAEEMLGKLP